MKELFNIQQELKAPKDQKNDFGGYKYRSCESILEAVKPLLKNNNCILTINDELVQVGDRYYIKATATLTELKDGKSISNSAYAREEETKKGMDASQITGATSSYARKYALNGLFAIDDNKDADTNEYQKQTANEEPKKKKTYREQLGDYCSKNKIDKNVLATKYGITAETTDEEYKTILEKIKEGK